MKMRMIVIFAGLVLITSCAKKSGESFDAQIIKGPYIRAITENSATIMWETDIESKSIVEYGTTNALGEKAESQSELKELAPDVNDPSSLVFANINTVTLTGLQPDTTYYYRIKSLKEPTDTYTFRTVPQPGSNFRFVVYGDNRGAVFGEQENHRKVVSAVLNIDPQPLFVLNPGDLVFSGKMVTNQGTNATFNDEWQLFFDVIKPLASHTAYYPIFGNHDNDGTSEKTRIFSAYFPSTGSSTDATYYSFDAGSVHFIILNSEIDYNNGSAQYNWLESDLKNLKPETKFVIANIHRPPYTISAMHASDSGVRAEIVPLLEQYKVDIMFNGHNHQYERTKMIKGGVENTTEGIIYVVAGGGGAPLYECKTDLELTPEEQAYKNICIKTFNYVIGDVDCTGTCKITFTAYSPDSTSPIDSFEITTRR